MPEGVRDEALYAAIGRLVLSWGLVEAGVDAMVDITRRLEGKNAKHPRALKQKLEFLAAYFANLPIPEDSLAGYASLLRRIGALAEIRHDIVHGFAIEHGENTGQVSMVRLQFVDGKIVKKPVSINTLVILKAAQEANELSGKALFFANTFYDLVEGMLKSGELILPGHSSPDS